MGKNSITFEDLGVVAGFINSLDEVEDKIEIPDNEVEGEDLIVFASAIIDAGQNIPEEIEVPNEIIDLYDVLVDQYDQKSGVFERPKKEKVNEVTQVKNDNNKKRRELPMEKKKAPKVKVKKETPKKTEKVEVKVEIKKETPKKEQIKKEILKKTEKVEVKKEIPKKINIGIGKFVIEKLISKEFINKTNKEIAEIIRKKFGSNTSAASIAWYKNKIKS
jgi:hypothetical protein